jgi:hypothetical protein
MKRNKKIPIIILVSLIVILIIAITVILINHKNNIQTTETSALDEFIDTENIENEEENIIVVMLEGNGENEENQNTALLNNEDKIEENNTNTTTQENYDGSYYIKVNIQANVVTIYSKDTSGNYTIPVKAMVCSIGTDTPKSGVYSTINKYEWRALIGNVYGQYATRIVGSILFHSVPYTKQDPSTLEYWEYDKLGTTASAGCIRLTVADAKWIYDNCKLGTKVEFYSDSNPGPLGKPTAQKISNEDDSVRGWDPTDPRTNNPWKTYNEKQEDIVNEEQNTQNENIKEENTNNKNSTTESNSNNAVLSNTIEENSNKIENKNKTVNNTTTNNIIKENENVISNTQENATTQSLVLNQVTIQTN